MTIASNKDKAEFKAFCIKASNAQLQGIYDKEKSARRTQYAALAAAEAWRRGITLNTD